MVKIDKSVYAFNDTLKAEDLEQEKQVSITEIKEVSTRFGEKFIAVLSDDTQIFLNSLSLQNLAEGISDETNEWKGKEVIVSLEASERTRGKKTIVVLANEDQRFEVETKEE